MARAAAVRDIPNGAGMAAILAAGIGCAALGLFAFLADASPRIGAFVDVYPPSGALSGVTSAAILVWLASWYVLARRWAGRNVAVGRCTLAYALLAVGLLLTSPPVMDLLQGR